MSTIYDQIAWDIELYGYGLDDTATNVAYTYASSVKKINLFYRNVLINDEAAAFVIARGNPPLPAFYDGPELIGDLEDFLIFCEDVEDGDGIIEAQT